MAHIFISYSRKDIDFLSMVTQALEKHNHTTWWDTHSIQGGEDWQNAISRGIAQSDLVIALLSPNSIQSDWVAKELAIALDKNKIIIPIKISGIDDSDLPVFIHEKNIHILDASANADLTIEKLLKDLGGPESQNATIPFTIGHPRLVQFIGRNEELQNIHRQLTIPKGVNPGRVVVSGMGGIGKTQTCIEYAHRYRYFFPGGIIYFDCQLNISEQLLRLAPVVTPKESYAALPDKNAIIDTVSQWLREIKRALIILDNVPSITFLREMEIGFHAKFLSLQTPMLLNSRSRIEAADITTIDLGALTTSEAMELVSRGRPDLMSDPDTSRLCDILGNIPLALSLAAAFFSRKPKATSKNYIIELEKRGWEASISLGRIKQGDIEAYPAASFRPSLKAQWNLINEETTGLLLLAAALHPINEPVPVARLSIMTNLSDEDDGIHTDLSDAIHDALTANLILRVSNDRVKLHAIIQDFILHQAFDNPHERKIIFSTYCYTAFNGIASVKSNFIQRGFDEVTGDLGNLIRIFDDQSTLTNLLNDWLELLQGHVSVFKALSPLMFEQHVLLVASLSEKKGIETLARNILDKCKEPYFSLKWSNWRPAKQLGTRLIGDKSRTKFIAVDDNGKTAVNYTESGTLQIWSLPHGTLVAKLTINDVKAMDISSDGKRLALLMQKSVKVYELPSLNAISTIDTGEEIQHLVFHSSNIVIGFNEKVIITFELGNTTLTRLHGFFDSIKHVFCLDEEELLISLGKGQFKIYNFLQETTSLTAAFENEDQIISDACKTGDEILAVTNAGLCLINCITGDTDIINPDFFSRKSLGQTVLLDNARYVAEASFSSILRVAEVAYSNHVFQLSSNTYDNIIVGAKNAAVFISGNDQYSELNFWDLSKGLEDSASTTSHERELVSILTVNKGKRFVTTSTDYTARLWDRKTGQCLVHFKEGIAGYAKGLAKTVADDYVLVGYTFKTVIYHVETGEKLYEFKPPCDGVTAIAMAPSGSFFLTGSSDGILMLWSEHIELLNYVTIENDHEICSIVISHDEAVIAGGTSAGTVFTDVNGRASSWTSGKGFINCVCLSPDAQTIYTSHHNGEICAWDISSQKLSFALKGHTDSVTSLSLVNAETLISASSDQTIRIWSLSKMAEIQKIVIGVSISVIEYQNEDATMIVGLATGQALALKRTLPF